MSAEPSTTVTDGPAQPGAAKASRAGLDVRRFGWFRPLAGDYAYNFSRVSRLFAGDPQSPEAWRDAVARSHRHPRKPEEISRVIAGQQERRGAPPEARAAGALLANPLTVAVVTGQQAGAFGGPLFTLLKAVTAIQLARKAAAEQGCPAVAVFWVDAEDHDWEEVSSCTVLDETFQPRTVTLAPPEGAGELPVAALTLDGRIEQAPAALEAALANSDFKSSVLEAVRAAWKPGAGMADAFAQWLETVLGRFGLIVFDSSDKAAKPLTRDVFIRELTDPGRTAALATSAGDALAALGHQPQVTPNPDSVSLFHLNGERRPIRRQGDRFAVGDDSYSADALLEEARTHPDRFSPNVLLRPIVQDTLFPTIAYVPGPSELAYLGQLGGVYEHFGIPMPLMYPRATATLIDAAAARFLAKYEHELPIEELQPHDESALNRLLHSQLPAEVEQSLTDAEASIRRTMQRVIEAMPAFDPTLAGAAKTTLGRMEHDLRGLQSKVIQAAKRRDETLRRQYTRAQAQIFPLGQPQERTLGVVFFLNRYGPALVERLLAELPLDLGKHWVIVI